MKVTAIHVCLQNNDNNNNDNFISTVGEAQISC